MFLLFLFYFSYRSCCASFFTTLNMKGSLDRPGKHRLGGPLPLFQHGLYNCNRRDLCLIQTDVEISLLLSHKCQHLSELGGEGRLFPLLTHRRTTLTWKVTDRDFRIFDSSEIVKKWETPKFAFSAKNGLTSLFQVLRSFILEILVVMKYETLYSSKFQGEEGSPFSRRSFVTN